MRLWLHRIPHDRVKLFAACRIGHRKTRDRDLDVLDGHDTQLEIRVRARLELGNAVDRLVGSRWRNRHRGSGLECREFVPAIDLWRMHDHRPARRAQFAWEFEARCRLAGRLRRLLCRSGRGHQRDADKQRRPGRKGLGHKESFEIQNPKRRPTSGPPKLKSCSRLSSS